VAKWEPLEVVDDHTTLWVLDTFKELAAVGPHAGCVYIGFATDNLWLPADAMQQLYATVREAKAQAITTHTGAGATFNNRPSAVQNLQK
jgi:hypothetical protein